MSCRSPKANSKVINVSVPQKMKITRRAYELWQQAGEPKDRDDEFYLQAERELNVASETAITTTTRPAPSHGRLQLVREAAQPGLDCEEVGSRKRSTLRGT